MTKFRVALSDWEIAGQIALLLNQNNRLTKIHTAQTILNSPETYFVEMIQSKVVGCVGLWRTAPMDKIIHLSVCEGYRSHGIAKKLLQTALTNSNHDVLYMSVREDNYPCLNLAKQFGFNAIAYIPKHGYNLLSLCLFRRNNAYHGYEKSQIRSS
jgi:ribosomal protein S18 acetylase RimI-like enzyme